jgi:hypothetical protein
MQSVVGLISITFIAKSCANERCLKPSKQTMIAPELFLQLFLSTKCKKQMA